MEISTKAGELAREHHAFYEVQPYYVVINEKAGSRPATRSVRAGFDVDIYGVAPNNKLTFPGSDYALGYAELQKAAARDFAAYERVLLTRGYSVPVEDGYWWRKSRRCVRDAANQNLALWGSRSACRPAGRASA